jgi:endonuclease III
MRRGSPLKRGAKKRLTTIDALLDAHYGCPEDTLGNKADPLDEAVYIILSFQTEISRARSTWEFLRSRYSTWELVSRAKTRDLAHVLRRGGLHKQKARTIKRLLTKIDDLVGAHSLELVNAMADRDAETFLTRLPGLSWKAARCILLYSLHREVFPVDGNTFRILKRTGVLSSGAIYRRRGLHDELQAAVPSARRRALHVNLVVHGQRTCQPRFPRCLHCPLSEICPRMGV